MTLNNEKTKKIIYFLSVLIISAIAIIPYCVYIGFQIIEYVKIEFMFEMFINSFPFQIFYFLCYSTIFNLYPLNKKVILLSFLSFLLIFLIWHSLSYIIPIGFLYLKNEKLNIQIVQRLIITNIFYLVIFFILACLSYNKFVINDIKSINKFFALAGNTIIFSLIIYFILFIISVLYFVSLVIMNDILDFELDRDLQIFLFLEFIALLGLLSPLLRPYQNKLIFIMYNILLVLTAATLFFISPNYKAGVFTKAVYLITPIFSALFNLVVLSATIFRIIEYKATATKIILLLTNIVILVHLIIISVCNIKSIIKSLNSEAAFNIGNDKIVLYMYVYGILAFSVCFIIPIIFQID